MRGKLLSAVALVLAIGASGCGGEKESGESTAAPAMLDKANVFLTVYCRHPSSAACDRVVVDVQNVRPRARAMSVSLLGRAVELRPLRGDQNYQSNGSAWRGNLPDANLASPPIEYDETGIDERRPRDPLPVVVTAILPDGSTAERTENGFLTLPDLAPEYGGQGKGYRVAIPVRQATPTRSQSPVGWRISRKRLTPRLGLPREIFSAGTFRMRPGGTCLPARAMREMSRYDALVSIQELLDRRPLSSEMARSKGFPPRPSRFVHQSGSDGCFTVPHVDTSFIPFSDAGRRFYALIVTGDRVRPALKRQALAILDGMKFFRQDSRDADR